MFRTVHWSIFREFIEMFVCQTHTPQVNLCRQTSATCTNTANFGHEHFYELRLSCGVAVHQCTVLNTVGNCNTVVNIVIL
jgi:hypothetical protein